MYFFISLYLGEILLPSAVALRAVIASRWLWPFAHNAKRQNRLRQQTTAVRQLPEGQSINLISNPMHEYPNNYHHNFAHYLPSIGKGNGNPEPPFPNGDTMLYRTLWVAENGDDQDGERNNISKPFRSIEGALSRCQDGDVIMVCPGTYSGVAIARRVTLFFLPESATSNTMSINADGVQIKAWGARLTGVLGQRGYSYSIEGGEFGASVRVNAGVLSMNGVTVKGASVTISSGGTVIARNCDFDRVSGTAMANCELYGCRVISPPHAIMLSVYGARAVFRNSTLIGNSNAEAIVVNGALDISHCHIQSNSRSAIKFTQSLRARNSITHSQLIGRGESCIDFIPNQQYPQLFFDSNSTNRPIPIHNQLEEGINTVNEAVAFRESNETEV